MTRASLHSRMIDHLDGQRRRLSKNPLWRHDRDHHNGTPMTYVTTIEASERKIVRHHVNEALRIERQDPTFSMNERQENGRGGIVRITASRVAY